MNKAAKMVIIFYHAIFLQSFFERFNIYYEMQVVEVRRMTTALCVIMRHVVIHSSTLTGSSQMRLPWDDE